MPNHIPPDKDGLRIYLVGGFRVLVGPRVIPATAGRLQHDQLLDCLWPDRDPAAATNNLHCLLQPTLAPGQPSACQTAQQRRDPAAYAAALALYGGERLPADRYADWAASRRGECWPACRPPATTTRRWCRSVSGSMGCRWRWSWRRGWMRRWGC